MILIESPELIYTVLGDTVNMRDKHRIDSIKKVGDLYHIGLLIAKIFPFREGHLLISYRPIFETASVSRHSPNDGGFDGVVSLSICDEVLSQAKNEMVSKLCNDPTYALPLRILEGWRSTEAAVGMYNLFLGQA
jgi:hypothetical protein